VRKRRSDQGSIRWTERDLAVLRWIGEQYLIRLDQLQVLLGRRSPTNQTAGTVARTTASNAVTRWQRAGVVERRALLVGQPTCLWLTRAGLEALTLPYRSWTPKPEGLTHLLAINQARLWVERAVPEAQWRSERAIQAERPYLRRQDHLGHTPDAELHYPDGRSVAVEVELSLKTPQRLPAIVYDLAARYEGIWYFCPQAVEASLRRAITPLDPAAREKVALVLLP